MSDVTAQYKKSTCARLNISSWYTQLSIAILTLACTTHFINA